MSLIFKEEGHVYENLDPNDNIQWKSVTSVISKFKKPFDADAIAVKCSKNKKSQWYGIEPEEIKAIWGKENKRAVDLGTFYHNQREADLLSFNTLNVNGYDLPVIPPKIIDGVKYAPEQKLNPGVYPEHFVYLKSVGICGQADYVDVVNDTVNILDYKTNKEIKLEGYRNWKGEVDCLSYPLEHIEDCNYYHYAIQMSIYMYMILKHNRKLKPGKLTLRHIIFENEGEDKYGYPIIKYLENGDPMVKETVEYEVPYLKDEVISIINWLKEQ